MSTSPEAIAILQGPCHYCGNYHVGVCPRIKSIEYHQNGTVARVEFYDTVRDPQGYPLGPCVEKKS